MMQIYMNFGFKDKAEQYLSLGANMDISELVDAINRTHHEQCFQVWKLGKGRQLGGEVVAANNNTRKKSAQSNMPMRACIAEVSLHTFRRASANATSGLLVTKTNIDMQVSNAYACIRRVLYFDISHILKSVFAW